MNQTKPCQLLTPKGSYTFDYPEAIQFADVQNDHFWLHSEIAVEKDLQDMKVNMEEAEYHGVVTTLKLFTLYELFAGSEYWGERVMKTFPRPDIQRMANCFSFYELNIHAPFYNKLNEVLNLNTDEFYNGYVNDPVLKARMDFIDEYVNHEDHAISLGVFSMVEGAILYSSFAFLKHFQAQGKNKLLNVVRGINFSVRDENLHSEGGAWLFRKYVEEQNYTPEQLEALYNKLREVASIVYEHECKIIEMIFAKGKIKGITETQLKHFVQSRLNFCLENLGAAKLYTVRYNPIANWFYKNINTINLHDFFTGMGNSYNRDWDEKAFIWWKPDEVS